jgi:hypothetical protein
MATTDVSAFLYSQCLCVRVCLWFVPTTMSGNSAQADVLISFSNSRTETFWPVSLSFCISIDRTSCTLLLGRNGNHLQNQLQLRMYCSYLVRWKDFLQAQQHGTNTHAWTIGSLVHILKCDSPKFGQCDFGGHVSALRMRFGGGLRSCPFSPRFVCGCTSSDFRVFVSSVEFHAIPVGSRGWRSEKENTETESSFSRPTLGQ